MTRDYDPNTHEAQAEEQPNRTGPFGVSHLILYVLDERILRWKIGSELNVDRCCANDACLGLSNLVDEDEREDHADDARAAGKAAQGGLRVQEPLGKHSRHPLHRDTVNVLAHHHLC